LQSTLSAPTALQAATGLWAQADVTARAERKKKQVRNADRVLCDDFIGENASETAQIRRPCDGRSKTVSYRGTVTELVVNVNYSHWHFD
jgi:hypothetical protein